ncbi:MAG: hypothetical protein ACI9QL_003682, partial [Candidatus Omnitrophota bacterium]
MYRRRIVLFPGGYVLEKEPYSSLAPDKKSSVLVLSR